ncbi:hypothetical protein NQ317_002935 [Molorchus minor]|uniref:Fe2OG dioxygenase domain-containing protein n=1 Tax=Molorchus minor TaxID=1323400 RepID=A0ABQ9J2S5_9CUCU|nr:hypothetical protein NQ317_002935 [Molorchus minor]
MKRVKIDLQSALQLSASKPSSGLKKVSSENLDVEYTVLLPAAVADELMAQLQQSVEYYEGDLTKVLRILLFVLVNYEGVIRSVKVFGKWHEIPRQQVAYGDEGMKYTFSGVTIKAKPWIPILIDVRDMLHTISGYQYNFVLINRYRNGKDHIGEHRDDEKEMDKNTPIASLSLGEKRTFVLKHRDARIKRPSRRDIPPVKIELEHGSLLLMNPPTNEYWYHSVPPRKSAKGVRINLTFRKINLLS